MNSDPNVIRSPNRLGAEDGTSQVWVIFETPMSPTSMRPPDPTNHLGLLANRTIYPLNELSILYLGMGRTANRQGLIIPFKEAEIRVRPLVQCGRIYTSVLMPQNKLRCFDCFNFVNC